jgi:hypothetical protein
LLAKSFNLHPPFGQGVVAMGRLRGALISRAVGAVVMTLAVGVASTAPAAASVAVDAKIIRFDGSRYDRAGAIAVDGRGHLVLAGSVESNRSTNSFAVANVTRRGETLWTAHYDGSLGGAGGQANAVALDGDGNIYAAGYIHNGEIFSQNYDYLVVSFEPDGDQRWAVRYDGPGGGADIASRIAVDDAGTAYVTGNSYGRGFDWATLKLAPDGTRQWLRRHSGTGSADDWVADMALSPTGQLVLAGTTRRTGDGLTGDVETLTYGSDGTIEWRRRWTATPTSHEVPADLDVDGQGRIAVTGTTAADAGPYAVPFPVTNRYAADGTLLQTIRDEAAGGSAVTHDAAGNVYLAGFFFATPDASSLSRYDAAGDLAWTIPLSGGEDTALGDLRLAVHAAGQVTLAGSLIDVFTGDMDYLTIRYGTAGDEQWRDRFAGDAAGQDRVSALVVDATDAALVSGTSWNQYVSIGGTADDIVTVRYR